MGKNYQAGKVLAADYTTTNSYVVISQILCSKTGWYNIDAEFVSAISTAGSAGNIAAKITIDTTILFLPVRHYHDTSAGITSLNQVTIKWEEKKVYIKKGQLVELIVTDNGSVVHATIRYDYRNKFRIQEVDWCIILLLVKTTNKKYKE